MHSMEANVLIIGKTGVGKSSFLNYLYGENVREAVAGAPVTGEGIFQETFTLENGLTVHLYDTWGLEADKAERWRKLIMDEVERHDGLNIRDWFHTIIYCLSAKSARVEGFEKELIRELLEGGNRVLVALTHCDTKNVDNSIPALRAQLCDCGMQDSDIINVCSVSKTLLGGGTSEPFGRDLAIRKIVSDLWQTIVRKLPAQIGEMAGERLDQWQGDSERFIDRSINYFNRRHNKKLRKVGEEISGDLRSAIAYIRYKAKEQIRSALEYYTDFTEMHSALVNQVHHSVKMPEAALRFEMSMGDRFAESLAEIIVSLIPLIGPILTTFSAGDRRRDEMKKLLREQRVELDSSIADFTVALRQELERIAEPIPQ